MTLGLSGFAARGTGTEPPRIEEHPKTAASTVPIKKGHPVVRAADGTIARATVTANLLDNAAILGFSAEWDDSDLPRGFAIPPIIKNEAGLQAINVFVATGKTIFSGNLRSTITAAQTLVGQAADLYYDATLDMFFVDTGTTTTGTIKIMEIVPGNVGVAGGLVDFIVVPGDSQWTDTLI